MKGLVKKAAGTGLMVIIVAVIMVEAIGLVQYYFSQKTIREEASKRAQAELELAQSKIMDVVNQTETAVHNSIWVARWCLGTLDSLDRIPRRIVEDNPIVAGSTMALVPGFDRKNPLRAPYALRTPSGIEMRTLATPEYDYPSQEWFTKPIEIGDGYWSEPYIDTGGGDIAMTTYSTPIKDEDGNICAVLTADISLDWLTELVGEIDIYPNAIGVVLSRAGRIMVSPTETLSMRSSVQEISARWTEDKEVFDSIAHSMLRGDSGVMRIHQKGKANQVYFAPMSRTGWSMSIVIPEGDIYSGIRKVGAIIMLLQLLGIVLLIIIIRSSIVNQMKFKKLSDSREKMESELKIGRGIQMSMIPKIFPPFPERKDIDMAGSIVPAKEVGGDLYDFYIKDERLYFCIGDVSGKGVPASLVMAVTRSLFRTVSAHEKSPQRIVTLMNESMSDMNESNMFVTLFCGVLDLVTGHLRYCNAGHNPPMLLTDRIQNLDVVPNIPLGVMPEMSFREQEIDLNYDDALFLYTDGLTEAENAAHELFGEERALQVLHTRRPSDEQLSAVQDAVATFVDGAPQSDDLTMLFIHYLAQPATDTSEQHLILHNNIQQIPQLAEFIETIAEEMKLDQGLAMGLNLALEEAVSNVILYAYPEGSDGLVDIEAIIRKDSLSFIITDSGKPFDPTVVPDADTSLAVEDRPIGGLGIYLVRNLMDEVSYERNEGKNILSMTKKQLTPNQ